MAIKISKTYEWGGVDSLSLALTIDGKKRDITFPPGREKPKVNAQYETTDEDIQAKIEGCHLFRIGQIQVKFQRTIADAAPVTDAKVTPPKVTGAPMKGVYPSVTTIQQAADKLIGNFAISADLLKTPDAILAKAEELGVSFPNLLY